MTLPGKPFVILARPRSGTNYLNWKLHYSQQVLLGWEPFNAEFQSYTGFEYFNVPEEAEARMQSVTERDRDPLAYIEHCAGFTGALDHTGVRSTGFKIFPEHNSDIYWHMTRDPRFNALMVERQSRIAAYSSVRIAILTNEWARETHQPAPDRQVKIRFDPEDFRGFLEEYDGHVNQTLANLREAGVNHLHLHYEDFVGNPDAVRQIFAFLGLEGEPTADESLHQQNSTDLLARFENPEDVRPWLDAELEAAALF